MTQYYQVMRVESVTVEGLFGELNHKIDMKSEGLTFIFGLNGSGKTTTLQIIDNLFNMRFAALSRAPFARVVVMADSGVQLIVERRLAAKGVSVNARHELVFEISTCDEPWTFESTRSSRTESVAWVSRLIPNLIRVGPRVWADRLSGERLSLDEVIARYDGELPGPFLQPDLPTSVQEFLDSVPVYFIRADRLHVSGQRKDDRPGRLVSDSDEQSPWTVEDLASDLAEKLRSALADYAGFSQSLESSFPSRFLEKVRNHSSEPTQDSIRERYSAQAATRASYVKSGLLEPGDDLMLPKQFDAETLQFLDAYLADVDQKLEKLSNFAAKLELFLGIVNSKLRRKQLMVDRRIGLRIDGRSGEVIPLRSLSSGEQQQIVLAYRLLFHENPGSLVLIDEPELSLHVAWQFKLVPDFLRIASMTNLRFLIATHSPQVINGRDDITVYLEDGVRD